MYLSLFLGALLAPTVAIDVQEMLHIISDSNFNVELLSAVIFSIQESQEVVSSIARCSRTDS